MKNTDPKINIYYIYCNTAKRRQNMHQNTLKPNQHYHRMFHMQLLV